MGKEGWTSVSLKDDIVARIDAFLAQNDDGFSNRPEVIATAVRQFLKGQEPAFTRDDLRKALKDVAATKPETVQDLLSALLAELDLEVRKAPHQATTGKSSSESSKRR